MRVIVSVVINPMLTGCALCARSCSEGSDVLSHYLHTPFTRRVLMPVSQRHTLKLHAPDGMVHKWHHGVLDPGVLTSAFIALTCQNTMPEEKTLKVAKRDKDVGHSRRHVNRRVWAYLTQPWTQEDHGERPSKF